MGTGDSPVHPPGELNISGTRKSWELGKMMHEKMKANSNDAAKPVGKDMGKCMDCRAMHKKMHGTDAAAPAH